MNKIVKYENRCIYDVETTGLSFDDDDIIQLSALRIIDGIENGNLDTYVATNVELTHEIIELTGIKPEDIPTHPTQTEAIQILEDFLSKLEKKVLVGYNNIYFDNNFIKRRGFNFDNVITQDVYEMCMRCNPVKKKMENMKLETFAKELNLDIISHTSDGDCIATNALYDKFFSERPTPTSGNTIKTYHGILDGNHHNIYSNLKLFDKAYVEIQELDNSFEDPFAPNYIVTKKTSTNTYTIFCNELKLDYVTE